MRLMCDAMLIRSNEFMTDQMPGNCGINVAYRLAACYCDEPSAHAEYKRQLDRGNLHLIGGWTEHSTISTLLESIRHAEGGRAHARAYPLDWAYSEVLEGLHYGTYAMLAMTDTEEGRGDGHAGEFATRHFANWLLENDLVSGTPSVGVRHPDSEARREVYGWFLIPDKSRIEEHLSTTRDTIKAAIQEYNDEPSIKKSEKKERSEEEKIASAISDGFDVDAATQTALEARVFAAAARADARVSPYERDRVRAGDFSGPARAFNAQAVPRLTPGEIEEIRQRQGATVEVGEGGRLEATRFQRWYTATTPRARNAETIAPPAGATIRGRTADQVIIDNFGLDEPEYPEDEYGEEDEF